MHVSVVCESVGMIIFTDGQMISTTGVWMWALKLVKTAETSA